MPFPSPLENTPSVCRASEALEAFTRSLQGLPSEILSQVSKALTTSKLPVPFQIYIRLTHACSTSEYLTLPGYVPGYVLRYDV